MVESGKGGGRGQGAREDGKREGGKGGEAMAEGGGEGL
jgi:hypothetical protein